MPGSRALIAAMAVAATVVVVLLVRFRLLRLDRAPTRHEPLAPGSALIAAIGLLVLGQVGLITTARLAGIEPGPDLDLRGQAILSGGLFVPQFCAAAVWLVAASRARRERGIHRVHGRGGPGGGRAASLPAALAIGTLGLALAWPLVTIVSLAGGIVVEALGGPPSRPVAHETLRALIEAEWTPWATIVVVQSAVLAPVVEEVLYRGCLQGGLARIVGRWPALLVTSGIFMFMHVGAADPGALAALFALSIGFGLVLERTGRLAAPIIMHMLFNGANLLLALG